VKLHVNFFFIKNSQISTLFIYDWGSLKKVKRNALQCASFCFRDSIIQLRAFKNFIENNGKG